MIKNRAAKKRSCFYFRWVNLNRLCVFFGVGCNLCCYALFFTGVTINMGIPVLHLLVLAAVHRIDLAVVVDLAQAPANAVVTWHYQYMIQQISFRFCVCCITSIQIGGDCVSSFYQFSKLLVGCKQICVSLIWFSNFIDVGVVSRIVSVVVAIAFLAQIVLRVTVVSAPAVDDEGVQVRCYNLGVDAGNIGTNVQLDIVIAQTIGEGLRQYICCI